MAFFARLTGRDRPWNFWFISISRAVTDASLGEELFTYLRPRLAQPSVRYVLYAAARTRHIKLIFHTRFYTRSNYNNNRPPRLATDRWPLTLRRLCSFCEIDLTYSLVYANWRCVAPRLSERPFRVILSEDFPYLYLINSLNFRFFAHYIPNSIETGFIYVVNNFYFFILWMYADNATSEISSSLGISRIVFL